LVQTARERDDLPERKLATHLMMIDSYSSILPDVSSFTNYVKL